MEVNTLEADGISYEDARLVLFASDSEEGGDRCQRRVDGAGARGVRAATFADACRRIEEGFGPDAIFLDIAGPPEDELYVLARTLGEAPHKGRLRSVIVSSLEVLDQVFAIFADRTAQMLCAASDLECAAALGIALVPRPRRLQEERIEVARGSLAQIGQQAASIAADIAKMAGPSPSARLKPDLLSHPVTKRLVPSDIRETIRARRLRDDFLGESLFADPAWDILLDLMASRLEEKRVSVSSLCIAAAVPPTTALRHIALMTGRGLLIRVSDPDDRRRVHIALSEQTAIAMTGWFAAARDESGVLS